MDPSLSPEEVYFLTWVWFVGFAVLQATALAAHAANGRVATAFNFLASAVVLATSAMIYPEFIARMTMRGPDIFFAVMMLWTAGLATAGVVKLFRTPVRSHQPTA